MTVEREFHSELFKTCTLSTDYILFLSASDDSPYVSFKSYCPVAHRKGTILYVFIALQDNLEKPILILLPFYIKYSARPRFGELSYRLLFCRSFYRS